MKKHILIFVKSDYFKTPYDRWLLGMEISPIIFVAEEYAKEYRHMEHVYSFADYDNNPLVEEKALEIASKLNLIGIFARAESDIIRAAKLREILQLKGQTVESALAYRDKLVMKNCLQKSKIIMPSYCKADLREEVINFAKQHGFPIVMKPRTGSGSFGINIINNEDELHNYLKEKSLTNMMAETFINGQMFHVDGLVVDGRVVFIQPSKYVNDCLSFRKNEYLGSCSLSPSDKLYQPLVDVTNEVLNVLPTPKNMTFHAEIWEKDDGQLVFCEIASRTGGSMISLTLKYCFGFDIDKLWFLAECGFSQSFDQSVKYQPAGWIHFPPLNGILDYIPKGLEPKYIKTSHYCAEIGKRYNGGVKSGLFLAGYVIGGKSEEEILKNIAFTVNWFFRESKWSQV